MQMSGGRRKFFALVLTLGASDFSLAQDSRLSFEESCKALIGQEVPNGTVVSAVAIAQGMDGTTPVPTHCKIQGKLNERRGIEAKKYAIGFELRLPEKWNERFYFQGGGGTDGVLRPAMGALPAGAISPNALSNGFAVVSTDAGHLSEAGPQGPYLFGVDPKARADYGYNSLPVVSETAKAIIEQVYGKAPKHSYFAGCSNGGRQAMMATQRFPGLFDGVIAGAPAYRVVQASIDAAAQTKVYASVAPSNPNGRPLLGQTFSNDELKIIRDGILRACDALDGTFDGMVNNIRDCKFIPTTIQCAKDQTTNCLSAEKAAALDKAFAGARTKSGELIYSHWPFDPGIASPNWTAWKFGPPNALPPQALNTTLVAGALAHVFVTPPQPTADLYGFVLNLDLDAALAKANNAVAPYVESGQSAVNADSTNIDAFTQRGGKIIFLHGMADGIFSPNDTVNYVTQLHQRYSAKADTFSRLYLIPGMGHCSGGPATDQFDLVSALVDWVEKDKAPSTIIAKAGGGSPWPNRTRPLCPYPAQAIYKGKGDIEDAKNFECK